MAGKKQSTQKKSGRPAAKKSAQSKAAPRSKSNTAKAKQQAAQIEQIRQRNQRSAIFWFLGAILAACLVLIPGENIWLFIHNVLRGLFGDWALILAVLMLYVAVTKAFEKTGLYRGARMVFVCLILFFWCAAVHLFGNAALPEGMGFFETIGYLYTRGVESGGAGLVGGMLGAPLASAVGVVGARILIVILLVGAVMLLTGTSLATLFRAMSRPAVKIHDVAQRRREERRLLEENRESSIDIPLGAVMPQHPVRSIPEEAESAAGGKKKKKGKSPQLENLEKVFGIKQTEPDHDPVVIQESEVEQPAAYPVEKLFDANRQVPDFGVPQVEAQPENAAESAAPERHAPVAHEVVEAETIPPAPAEAAAAQPVAPVTVADHAAQNPETAAEAERAVAESMRKKMEAEKARDAAAQGRAGRRGKQLLLPAGHDARLEQKGGREPRNRGAADERQDARRDAQELRRADEDPRHLPRPGVTRYELQPAAGVKISKITNLADDLAMNLAATGVRIEAPIRGKAAVGIEVPNKTKSIVRMRELIESNSFVTSKSHLTVALGRDIAVRSRSRTLPKCRTC